MPKLSNLEKMDKGLLKLEKQIEIIKKTRTTNINALDDDLKRTWNLYKEEVEKAYILTYEIMYHISKVES
ncbi:MAG: hypothetical protein KAQ98_07595 [Bacteriovoracaceae bacterium]|nr:hypothetical protein [Bacteriovoracaceae bacterium]